MKTPSYHDDDPTFGQVMLTLRTALGLTQSALADTLGVSRRAVGDWEASRSYPTSEHLKHFITLAIEQGAFTAGREAEEIRAFWKSARQKTLLDEAWLAALVPAPTQPASIPHAAAEHPLRDGRSYGFPFQPTSFVGRSAELAEITRILRDPACRLLTLLGPGGVGKTRLALETAHTAAYADGTAFVALASVASPNQIISAVADALSLSFGSEIDPAARLLEYLRERHMLLVLDNFEHLLNGVSFVTAILERAPGVTILTTSRERLNLHAEWLFDVQGLSYPQVEGSSSGASPDLVSASGYSAVQLFIQRVVQVQPGFALSEIALRTIVHICQRVVGMPLAIELAAASARRLSLAEIDRQISSNLDALATSLRDMPARHRSLRAAFDHSWHLMTAPERAAFTRLAVFRGGFTSGAAAQVAGASLPVLQALVDKSLVRPAESAPRLLMLEPIRDYALLKLNPQEAEDLRRAHALYFFALAQSTQTQWETPTAESALEILDRELDNMRAALQWAVSGGDAMLGLRLAESLVRYWRNRVYLEEARQWLEALLTLNAHENDLDSLALRTRTTYAAAMIYADRRDYTQAGVLFEQSRALRHALGESGEEMTMLINQAQQARTAGDYRHATALLEQSLAMYRAAEDLDTFKSGGYGFVLYFLAHMLREQGDYPRARAYYLKCREFHLDAGDREGAAQGLLGLSDVARDAGDTAEVRRYAGEALATYRGFGTQWAIGFSINNLAVAAYLDGNLDEAFALISESVAMFRAQKSPGSIAEVLVTMGAVLLAQGEHDGAYAALAESIRLGWDTGPRILIAAALEGLGCVLVAQMRMREAAQLFGAAALMREQMRAPMRLSDQPVYDRALARARSALGESTLSAAWALAQRLPLEQVVGDLVGIG